MAHSFNYKHTSDIQEKKYETKDERVLPGLSLAQIWVLAGTVFLGMLLLWSWSLDNLFMTELLTVSGIWFLISLVKLQSEPKNSNDEKR
jgi:hypothetical protein